MSRASEIRTGNCQSDIPTLNATGNNPVTCGVDGSIDFTFTNVPNGSYTITYTTGTFTNVSVTGGNATVPAPAGTYNDLQITVGNCNSAAGTTIVIQPAAMTGTAGITSPIPCSGGTATVTLTGTGGTAPLSYVFNGVTNTTGVFTGIAAGTAYAWSISDAGGCTPATGTLDIAQPASMSITSQPLPQTDCFGNQVEFSVAINGGTGTIGYQWQQRPPTGFFTDISGATSALLTINNIGASGQNINGTEYQVVITDACQTLTSDVVLLTVNSITDITPTDENSIICNIGGSITYAVSTQGSPPAGYQWLKQNGASWDPIAEGGSYSGTTTSQLTISNATNAQSGSYRVTVTFNTQNQPVGELSCTQTSSAWIRDLIVRDPIVRPLVTAAQSICNNTAPLPLTATAATGGSGPFTYQWQSSPDGLIPWTDIPGETALSYSPPALTSTTYYRIVATDGGVPACGFINSLPIVVVVDNNTTPTFALVAPICSGAPLAALPTSSIEGITGTWAPALDNTATTLYTFTPAAGQCASSATLTIVVNNNTTPTFAPVAPICSGAPLAALPTSSIEGITGTWAPALDNTATTLYTFTPAAGQCASSATLTIVVNNNTTPTFAPVAPICSGAPLAALPTSSIEGITGTWVPALDNTATTLYTFTPAAGQCASSATLTIVVNNNTTPTFAPVAPICSGAPLAALPTSSIEAYYRYMGSCSG